MWPKLLNILFLLAVMAIWMFLCIIMANVVTWILFVNGYGQYGHLNFFILEL